MLNLKAIFPISMPIAVPHLLLWDCEVHSRGRQCLRRCPTAF